MALPAIGIATPVERAAWGPWDKEVVLLARDYVHAVQRAGGLAVLLPPDARAVADPDLLLDRVDALVLAGGTDVDPGSYGAAPHPETGPTRPERDAFELALARRAVERDLPLLAICRGMQVVNVAFGGTLEQHLPDRLGTAHGDPVGGLSATHDVDVAPGSRLAEACGGAARLERVTSHHHQGIAAVGEGLSAVGWSPDGLVEAVEADDGRWLVAVQWHPEATAGHDEAQQALFDGFVAEARLASEVARI